MSSERSYSKESRSYYSRSASYENKHSNSNSSYRRRPLSSLLTERDFSSPSSALDHQFDDPFFFERRSRRFLDDFDRRLRWRFNDDPFDEEEFFRNNSLEFGRNIPINYRSYNNSSTITRNVPIQYSTASTNQREKVYKKQDHYDNWATSSFNNNSFNRRENRISTADWPPKQESPTRKRTSMTIFVRQPRVQYSDVPNHQRTMSTPTYSTTLRTNYY